MTLALSIAVAVLLVALLRQRRVARKRYGRLECEHRWEKARHGERKWRDGLAVGRTFGGNAQP